MRLAPFKKKFAARGGDDGEEFSSEKGLLSVVFLCLEVYSRHETDGCDGELRHLLLKCITTTRNSEPTRFLGIHRRKTI